VAAMADPLAALLRLDGVYEAVDAARAAVDVLFKERVLQRRRGEVTAESVRRGGWASAVLEGPTPDLASFYPPFGDDDAGRLAAASLRTTAAVGALAGVWSSAPLQALARLHTLVAADLVDDGQLGRPRTDAEVSGRLTQLAEFVTAPTQAPAVVVAAVVHAEVLTLEPFVWGNGLVARAAQRLVLVQRGVDPDALTVAEEGLLQLGDEAYRSAAAGYAAGSADGVARWLTFVASAVARGAGVGREVCRTLA
jgi:hypothetical protein